jgi:hypothetical protein
VSAMISMRARVEVICLERNQQHGCGLFVASGRSAPMDPRVYHCTTSRPDLPSIVMCDVLQSLDALYV